MQVIFKNSIIKQNILLVLIFLLALFLRVYRLESLPSSFHEDEVSNTYVGRFILQNGKDLYGNRWPLLYFDKFGDYPPVIPMYLSGLVTYVFGVNEFAARFPVALAGAIVVFPLYYISFALTNNKKISLSSALFISILPWHVVYSRSTSEGILGVTGFLFGLLFILNWIKEAQKWSYLVAAIFFFISTYFLYPSFRVIVPLALFPLSIIFKLSKQRKLAIFITFAFFLLVTFFISQTEWGKARYLQTSLFNSQETASNIRKILTEFAYDEGQNQLLTVKIFHNKGIGYFREFARQYLSYFSPDLLFLNGGKTFHDVYFSVPQQGLLYLSFAPLLFAGLLFAFLKMDRIRFLFTLFLLVLSVLPAALTVDFVPNMHRAIFMIVPLVFFAGYGYNESWSIKIKNISLGFCFSIFIIFEFIYFWHQYSRHSHSFRPIFRNDKNREIVEYVIKNRDNYDKVFMPSVQKLAIYYLFYDEDFNKAYAGKFGHNLVINSIGNIEFINNQCITNQLKGKRLPEKTMIIENGDCEKRNGFYEKKLILREDSTRAYKILELKKQ